MTDRRGEKRDDYQYDCIGKKKKTKVNRQENDLSRNVQRRKKFINSTSNQEGHVIISSLRCVQPCFLSPANHNIIFAATNDIIVFVVPIK
jgi:hypothetical protein